MPTPPQPKTTTEEPGVTLAAVDGGADAGGDPAADQRRDVPGDVVGDLDHALAGQQDLLGEGPGAGHAVDGLAPSRRKWGPPPSAENMIVDAQVGLPGQAEAAGAARRHPHDDDVVADGDVGDTGPDLDDFAGALVAEDTGRGLGNDPGHGRQVRVADTRWPGWPPAPCPDRCPRAPCCR